MIRRESLVVMVALVLALSAFLVSSVAAEGFFSDVMENIRNWFESSPLGSIFSAPVKSTEKVLLTFYSDRLEMEIEKPTNITTNSSKIIGFSGVVDIDRMKLLATFRERDSTLVIDQDIDIITFEEVGISELSLQNERLDIVSGNWNEKTENGSIEIKDFVGNVLVTAEMFQFEGNVSKIIKG